MAKTPESVRELRPHATWRAIEWLADLARAAVLTAVITAWQWLQHHWDIVTIAAVFTISLGLLVWRDFSSPSRRGNLGDGSRVVDAPSAPLHIISALWGIGGDAWKDVTETVRRHSKPDLINIPAQIGLLGDPYPGSGKYLKVVYSLAQRQEITVPEPQVLVLPEPQRLATERMAPDLSVTYVRDRPRPALRFETQGKGKLRVRGIGPVVSEALYRCEHDIVSLQEKPPAFDKNNPLECPIMGIRNSSNRVTYSLETGLEAGGPLVSDSVQIVYEDAERNVFSKRFFLHKNNDGTIVWLDDEEKLQAQDLTQLRDALKRPDRVSLLSFQRAVLETGRTVVVTMKSSAGQSFGVWTPLWENSTGDVLAQVPVRSGISKLRVAPNEADEWGDYCDCLEVQTNEIIRCRIELLEPNGDGIEPRLTARNTGTLVFPIKWLGKLAEQRIAI